MLFIFVDLCGCVTKLIRRLFKMFGCWLYLNVLEIIQIISFVIANSLTTPSFIVYPFNSTGYLVLVMTVNTTCSGALISPSHVLTSARSTDHGDIRINPKDFHQGIHAIDMQDISTDPLDECNSVGWKIEQVNKKLVPIMYRSKVLEKSYFCPCSKEFFNKRLICVKNAGHCPLDSGALLICGMALVGIGHVSYDSSYCSLSTRAAKFNMYSRTNDDNCIYAYSKICTFYDWLRYDISTNIYYSIPRCSTDVNHLYRWYIFVLTTSIFSMVTIYVTLFVL